MNGTMAFGRKNESTWLRSLLATGNSGALTALRMVLALVVFPHGAQKVLGWFGGFGAGPTLDYFETTYGIPVLFGILAMIAEFVGSIALFLGLLGRVAAFGILCVMFVAGATHVANGFFMNWAGTQAGEGFEFHILAIGIAAVLIAKGSGAFSIDRKLAGTDAV
jgi:putative oxidoreductase